MQYRCIHYYFEKNKLTRLSALCCWFQKYCGCSPRETLYATPAMTPPWRGATYVPRQSELDNAIFGEDILTYLSIRQDVTNKRCVTLHL